MFHPGPIFTQVLLADEINRATPKTQSGLLEAMEERQVTRRRRHARAAANRSSSSPRRTRAHQVGTFPLPESQLDRFLMCLTLGYPDAAAERALLMGEDRRAHAQDAAGRRCTPDELAAGASGRCARSTPPAPLVDYVQALAQASRQNGMFAEGLSPRAAIALLQAGARLGRAGRPRPRARPRTCRPCWCRSARTACGRCKSAHGTALASRDLVLQLQKSVPV